jgi:hypothetical protein
LLIEVFFKANFIMPKKGKAKNTVNKAKHTKLMNRKINKVKLEKKLNKERLKAIIKKANELKSDTE